jgi:hypothetical protein
MVCVEGTKQKNASAIHDLILWVKNCRIGKRNPKEVPSILYRNVPSGVNDELRD